MPSQITESYRKHNNHNDKFIEYRKRMFIGFRYSIIGWLITGLLQIPFSLFKELDFVFGTLIYATTSLAGFFTLVFLYYLLCLLFHWVKMKYYFLCLWLAILKTLKTWWMYIAIFVLLYFDLSFSILYLCVYVLGTKLYNYIDTTKRASEISFLNAKLRENKTAYLFMLYTQMIAIWGGAILFLISIYISLFYLN